MQRIEKYKQGTEKEASLDSASANGISSPEKNLSKDNTSLEELLESIFQLTLTEGLKKRNDPNQVIIHFTTPQDLGKILDMEIRDEPLPHHELLEICRTVFRYSVKTGNPHYFNHILQGVDPYGFAGEIVTDVLNTSIHSYEATPVFILLEQYLLKRFCDLVGYEEGDGIFPPGASYSNMLAMNLARFRKFPAIKEQGMVSQPRMVAFASAASHYSHIKNASLLGLGSKAIVSVKTDALGSMDPVDLERCIIEAKNQGFVPFLVLATAGTTVLGAFDPFNAIADSCQKHNLWLHVDAAWGGSVLVSNNHRHLMEGVHRSDSVNWNPHKMLMAPLQCSLFITKHADLFKICDFLYVSYLFRQDKTLYDSSYDIGSKAILCGRKVDAFKFWFMWKAHGNTGLGNRVDKAFDNARYLAEIVRNTEGFKLVMEVQCTNVCFWYIPTSLRDTKWDLNDEAFCHKLASVAPKIKDRMILKGSMMISHQPMKELPNFFRVAVINDNASYDDMEFIVREIHQLGHDL